MPCFIHVYDSHSIVTTFCGLKYMYICLYLYLCVRYVYLVISSSNRIHVLKIQFTDSAIHNIILLWRLQYEPGYLRVPGVGVVGTLAGTTYTRLGMEEMIVQR